VLLAMSCGLVGAGLLSVPLNFALLVIVVIWDAVSPAAGGDVDLSLARLLYFGVLTAVFLIFFALGMDRLVRWLKPTNR
jgi:hypothetical protein